MCARTYIQFIMHWPTLFVVVFREIRCLHYDVGRQRIEIYPSIKFFLPQCSVTCTYAVLAETVFFCVVFQETVFNHDDVCQVTELYLSTKFHVCQCCG